MGDIFQDLVTFENSAARQIASKVSQILGEKKDARILDVGAGTGRVGAEVCIPCHMTMHKYSVSVQCTHAVSVYNAHIQCRCTTRMYSDTVQCTYTAPVCSAQLQCQCTVHTFNASIQCIII